jgi:hypothetical protein
LLGRLHSGSVEFLIRDDIGVLKGFYVFVEMVFNLGTMLPGECWFARKVLGRSFDSSKYFISAFTLGKGLSTLRVRTLC